MFFLGIITCLVCYLVLVFVFAMLNARKKAKLLKQMKDINNLK